MTNAVPGLVAYPGLALIALVVLVRYRWFNTTLYETYLNNTLALVLAAELLRERAVQQLLAKGALFTVATTQQLSLAVAMFVFAEFIGFTMMWSELPEPVIRRRMRYYRLAALAVSVGLLISGTRARIEGQPLEVSGGWDEVVAIVFLSIMQLVMAFGLAPLAVKEVRRPEARRGERVVAAAAILLCIVIVWTVVESFSLATLEQLGWVRTRQYRVGAHGVYFFWSGLGCAALAAIPCVRAILARGGLDSVSRKWRQLQPLRQSMNLAVPESAFTLQHDDARRRKTSLQLHQSTVEIRDAILQLRAYFPHITPDEEDQFVTAHAIAPADRDAAVFALGLARAVRAKASGGTPGNRQATPAISRSTTLEQETAELVRFAKWWPVAEAASRAPREGNE